MVAMTAKMVQKGCDCGPRRRGSGLPALQCPATADCARAGPSTLPILQSKFSTFLNPRGVQGRSLRQARASGSCRPGLPRQTARVAPARRLPAGHSYAPLDSYIFPQGVASAPIPAGGPNKFYHFFAVTAICTPFVEPQELYPRLVLREEKALSCVGPLPSLQHNPGVHKAFTPKTVSKRPTACRP